MTLGVMTYRSKTHPAHRQTNNPLSSSEGFISEGATMMPNGSADQLDSYATAMTLCEVGATPYLSPNQCDIGFNQFRAINYSTPHELLLAG